MSKSTFSIISTLAEAFRLGIRQAKLLLGIAVLAAIPSMLWEFNVSLLTQTYPLMISLLSLPAAVVLFIINAMKTAAILGVLKSPQNDGAGWQIASSSIRTYTWPLVRLSFLLVLIAWVFIVPISMGVALFGKSLISPQNYALQLFLVFIAILYLMFIKFALADPLVVVEGMGAVNSLKKSWEMTRGRFGYVLGCYVFLGTAEYFVERSLGLFSPLDHYGFVDIMGDAITSLLGCLWILMAWCMYWRIKGHESQSAPIEELAN